MRAIMLAEQIAGALAAARTGRVLDDVARVLWRAAAEGVIGEKDAGRLGEEIEARRAALRERSATHQPLRGLGRNRRPSCRSPDRARSLDRRRRLVAAGWLPPQVAAAFTLAQQAALAIIAQQVARRGSCVLPIDAIAAIAGTSRTIVKDAVREAARLGLLTVTERRQTAWRNLPNLVRITASSWVAWLSLRGGRGRKPDWHATEQKNQGTGRSDKTQVGPEQARIESKRTQPEARTEPKRSGREKGAGKCGWGKRKLRTAEGKYGAP